MPVSETRFFLKESNTEVVFVTDDKGKVTHMLYRLHGQELRVRKIR